MTWISGFLLFFLSNFLFTEAAGMDKKQPIKQPATRCRQDVSVLIAGLVFISALIGAIYGLGKLQNGQQVHLQPYFTADKSFWKLF